ncbi:unnamed protein product [Closterium sp. NIES-64]|nr:unnamed protein product [Closterium sp. NIES-64]
MAACGQSDVCAGNINGDGAHCTAREECLNDVQINALLAFDARRYLIRAKERIENFNSFCCNVQSIFADIAFTHAKTPAGSAVQPGNREGAELAVQGGSGGAEALQVVAANTRRCAGLIPGPWRRAAPLLLSAAPARWESPWLPANSLTCVPATTTVMERSEGRSRSVQRRGVPERLQVNTLLAFDARRYLLRAGESVKALDTSAAMSRLSLLHVAFTHGKSRLGAQFDPTIEKASSFQWREAAEELRQSKWCSKNEAACKVDTQQLEEGCSSVGDNAVSAFLQGFRGFMAA